MRLKGRVALVTGGLRGIGEAISLALAREGADVAICDRKNEGEAKQVVAEIEALGRNCFFFQADVADYDKVKEMVAKTIDTFGKIDILINNAGFGTRSEFVADMNIRGWHRIMDTNFWGPLHFSQAVLPNMRQQPRGDIIFISTAEVAGLPIRQADYIASKSAMEAMARILAKEERDHGIRVNVVRPGFTETPMGVGGIKYLLGVDIDEARPFGPFGRIEQPSDISNFIVFLLSEEGSFITGQVISVNGGADTFEETFPGLITKG